MRGLGLTPPQHLHQQPHRHHRQEEGDQRQAQPEPGGGGERVLWVAVQHLLLTRDVVLYTSRFPPTPSSAASAADAGAVDTTNRTSDSACTAHLLDTLVPKQFGITLSEQQRRRLSVVYIPLQRLQDPAIYPVARLLLQSVVGGAALATTETPAPAKAGRPAKTARAPRVAKPVTRAEVQARIAKTFARLDTNHDGFITKDELSAIDAQREQKLEQRAQKFDPSKAFDRLDLNHDGKITTAEADAARSQRAKSQGGQPAQAKATAFTGLFARADTNKDNVLTKAEFDTMGQQIKARMEKAAAATGGMATRFFDKVDANKDGKVTLAEMQQTALARFDRLDLNHDGTITPQERQQARQAFSASHKAK